MLICTDVYGLEKMKLYASRDEAGGDSMLYKAFNPYNPMNPPKTCPDKFGIVVQTV